MLPVSSTFLLKVLDALHAVENPHNLVRPGKHGELGPVQFTRATWEETTTLPFTPITVWANSTEVGLKRLRYIEMTLRAHHVTPTAFRIAVAWKFGLADALQNERPPTAAEFEYADRVANLAGDPVVAQ
jgi:hypothetical protein